MATNTPSAKVILDDSLKPPMILATCRPGELAEITLEGYLWEDHTERDMRRLRQAVQRRGEILERAILKLIRGN